MKYAVWEEPYSVEPVTSVRCQMSFDEIVKSQMAIHPDYESAEAAFIDFVVVHWACVTEKEIKCDRSTL
jgi:hypothetical protein